MTNEGTQDKMPIVERLPKNDSSWDEFTSKQGRHCR